MKLLSVIFFFFISLNVFSQDMTKFKLYKPEENAEMEINKAIDLAKKEGKHVFIQVGGNWCIWCARFHEYITNDRSIDSLVNANYVVYRLNYSKENYNAKIFSRYGYPQRFGFPVFLILDKEGKLLHTQNSVYLEKDKGYDRNMVIGFFNDWSPKALQPSQYNDQ